MEYQRWQSNEEDRRETQRPMKAVVLQPTYLPWMGYFGMMDLADVFVFYDDVQFVKQSWQQRNRIKSSDGKWIWLSVHILQKFGQNINEVQIVDTFDWRKKHWASINQLYGKAPHFEKYRDDLEDIYKREWKFLSELNIFIITRMCELFGIKVPVLLRSSALGELTGKSTERLLLILEKIGADTYIGNPGSKEYIEVDRFKEKGMDLYWYEYQHPVYPQIRGEFVPYLSAIDLLFNTGELSCQYIREGSKDALKLDESFTEGKAEAQSIQD